MGQICFSHPFYSLLMWSLLSVVHTYRVPFPPILLFISYQLCPHIISFLITRYHEHSYTSHIALPYNPYFSHSSSIEPHNRSSTIEGGPPYICNHHTLIVSIITNSIVKVSCIFEIAIMILYQFMIFANIFLGNYMTLLTVEDKATVH